MAVKFAGDWTLLHHRPIDHSKIQTKNLPRVATGTPIPVTFGHGEYHPLYKITLLCLSEAI
jgi:hypothetical protein